MAHLQLIYLLKMVIFHGKLLVTRGYPPEKKNLVMFPVCCRVTTRLKPGSNAAEVAGKWYPGTRPEKPKNTRGVQWGNPQGKCIAGKIHDVMAS